jgi:ribosomal protein S18 acetylase RimI-like enzyme
MYFVRTAGERDLEKVRALLGESFHGTYDQIYGVEKASEIHATLHSSAALKTMLQKIGSEFVVADSGSEIGGMGYATMSAEMAKTALLHMLYVRPSRQRQGIGRDLFAELETCFPDAELMRVEVQPGNNVAINFFGGLGFDEVGHNENAGPKQSGIPTLVFEKSLVQH